jgi:hypothetical protein
MAAQLGLFSNEKRNQRIQVGLDDRTNRALSRYSKAVGKPKSRIAAELLQMLEPVMDQYAERVEELHRIGNLETFKQGMEAANHRLLEVLEGQLDAV